MEGSREAQDRVLELLRQSLAVEYGLIFRCPGIAAHIIAKQLAAKVEGLGKDSARHAEFVTRTILGLGAEVPTLNVEPLPAPVELVPTLHRQLEKDRLAVRLYCQLAELADGDLSASCLKIAEKEQQHVAVLEEVLSRLAT